MDRIDSEIIYTANSRKFGTIGYLVIDRLVCKRSFGGVRIVPDIDLFELQCISRSMTYKNVFVGNRIGGAKAAVIVSKENEKYKREILAEFGRCISPFIINKMYFPVMDMGITLEELQLIFNSSGYKCNVLSWKNLSHEYTAYSCFYSTLNVLEAKGIHIEDVTFSIQGFGNVGSTYANLMYKAGARLTAFSNKYGGIIDENGFNVEELIHEKLLIGDEFILKQPKDKQISHESILEKNVTILLLASNAIVINKQNFNRIGADIIICAANAPMTYDVERLLFKDNKTVITDFVANCGGILGSVNLEKDIILKILSTYYRKKVFDMLHRSIDSNIPFIDVVMEEIEKRINEDYNGTYQSRGLAEYIIDLFLNFTYPMNRITGKIVNNVLSKIYMTRYEMLWGQQHEK